MPFASASTMMAKRGGLNPRNRRQPLSGFRASLDQMSADQLWLTFLPMLNLLRFSWGQRAERSRRSATGPARFHLTHGFKRQVRMRVSAARTHFGGDPNRFHHLQLGCPCFTASSVWPPMQYGHWVTCATAAAMSCLVFVGNAPSANTRALNALNAG
jgi:hypothetical protein